VQLIYRQRHPNPHQFAALRTGLADKVVEAMF
jgi:hypothetical protein